MQFMRALIERFGTKPEAPFDDFYEARFRQLKRGHGVAGGVSPFRNLQ